MLPAKTVAYETAKALDEKKGVGIKLLKIDKVSSLADYFVFALQMVFLRGLPPAAGTLPRAQLKGACLWGQPHTPRGTFWKKFLGTSKTFL